jgi:C4-dicarboxylate-binding protein DctP
MRMPLIAKLCAAAAVIGLSTASFAQETIRLRIASGHPPPTPYVHLLTTFFVPEVTKRVAERTKHKVEFVEGYGGAMVKVADTLEGVQSGIIDIGAYCFCFEPSNLPLHAFQIMLPFGTMSPVASLKVARAVYDNVPFMSKVFEDKYRQKLLAIIADNGYNLGTNFEWNTVADLKGQKIAGAGLNLKWLEYAGVTPVQSSLAEFPKQKAKELDAQGMPATKVLEIALDAAEKAGHKWPVRYELK